jgi:nucleoside-diphosphate-sugar epimerase
MDGGLGEVFNIGSNEEISIGDLFALISKLMGTKARTASEEERMRPEKSEVFRLRCNNQKLRAASGFKPSVPLTEGLTKTIEWFRNPENLARYKPGIYNV